MKIDKEKAKELLALSKKARENSYSPYSEYKVGAALLAKSGKIYLGSNVENASFGATVCAERSALCSAVTAGEREFIAIAVVGGKDGVNETTTPCGICRQMLSEFGDLDVITNEKEITVKPLSSYLPSSFTLK